MDGRDKKLIEGDYGERKSSGGKRFPHGGIPVGMRNYKRNQYLKRWKR